MRSGYVKPPSILAAAVGALRRLPLERAIRVAIPVTIVLVALGSNWSPRVRSLAQPLWRVSLVGLCGLAVAWALTYAGPRLLASRLRAPARDLGRRRGARPGTAGRHARAAPPRRLDRRLRLAGRADHRRARDARAAPRDRGRHPSPRARHGRPRRRRRSRDRPRRDPAAERECDRRLADCLPYLPAEPERRRPLDPARGRPRPARLGGRARPTPDLPGLDRPWPGPGGRLRTGPGPAGRRLRVRHRGPRLRRPLLLVLRRLARELVHRHVPPARRRRRRAPDRPRGDAPRRVGRGAAPTRGARAADRGGLLGRARHGPRPRRRPVVALRGREHRHARRLDVRLPRPRARLAA